MPSFDFECRACRKVFEVQATYPEYAAMMKGKKIKCQMCGSAEVARVFSAPNVPSGASSKPRGGGGCCCPGGKCG